jgi:hypothetical protein
MVLAGTDGAKGEGDTGHQAPMDQGTGLLGGYRWSKGDQGDTEQLVADRSKMV